MKPSAGVVRALYQSDFSRGVLPCEMESSRESRYPSSEDDYMRFFPSTRTENRYASKRRSSGTQGLDTHAFLFAAVATFL